MYLRFALIGAELRAVGIDAELRARRRHRRAGDASVPEATAATAPIPVRSTAIARAAAEGLLAGGCLPVIKHMPGHGAATVDSHLRPADRSPPTPTTLRRRDFAPFAALADLPLAMTAHIVYPAFDTRPGDAKSPADLRLIRDEIGFGGLLMTDDCRCRRWQARWPTAPRRRSRRVAIWCCTARDPRRGRGGGGRRRQHGRRRAGPRREPRWPARPGRRRH